MNISEVLREYPDAIATYLEKFSDSGIVLIKKSGEILDCNDGFLKILGLNEKPVNRSIKKFISKSSNELKFSDDSLTKINLTLNGNGPFKVIVKGHTFPLNDLYIVIFEHYRLTYNELIQKMSKLNNDIVDLTSELEKKNAQLKKALSTVRRIMDTDNLTGVLNRRAFERALRREISFSLRHRLPLSLVFVDLDHFKKINDTYGHEAGDYVLRRFAGAIKKSIRQEDIFGRIGGEEFALALPNTNGNQAFEASERLRKGVEKLKLRDIKGNITASFGVTQLSLTDDYKSFLKRADDALYKAKRNGRNRCEIK